MAEKFTVQNEINYVQKATELDGQAFVDHLRKKAFVDPSFAAMWAAVQAILAQRDFGPRVLDLGCGPGWTSIFLAGRGLQVTGGDVSPDMLSFARENAQKLGMDCEFQTIDMQAGFDVHEPFDSVLIFDALHHCPDEVKVLRNAFAALRPGGTILIVEPDWFHEYAPSADHDRDHFGTTERGMGWHRVQKAMKKAGFREVERFYNVTSTPQRKLLDRLKAVVVAGLTVTVGFPHRPNIVLARKPR